MPIWGSNIGVFNPSWMLGVARRSPLPKNALICVTSDRSASLQRVCRDILFVAAERGIVNTRMVTEPNVDPRLYEDANLVIITMTFDPIWAIPYFFLARELKELGYKVIFYTTVEGRVKRTVYDTWILRDLSFVANSPYTARRLEEHGARIDSIVPHGVVLEKVEAGAKRARALRNLMGFTSEDFVVGYIAGCYMRKGHQLFSQVARILAEKDKSVKIVVLTQQKCASLYEGLPNVLCIANFGGLEEDMVYTMYHAFDLYAQASLAEGFGLPVLEALAAGKMVVHPDYDPLSWITTPETSVRVPVTMVEYMDEGGAIEYELHYYEPREFADAILYAKDLLQRNRDDIAAKARERAREFEARRVYKPFMETYGIILDVTEEVRKHTKLI